MIEFLVNKNYFMGKKSVGHQFRRLKFSSPSKKIIIPIQRIFTNKVFIIKNDV